MKLILKDNTEITITRMNNTYAYENFRDGTGADMGKNISATISIFDSEKSFDELKQMLSGTNREGFKITYGSTEKKFPTMKIAQITGALLLFLWLQMEQKPLLKTQIQKPN